MTANPQLLELKEESTDQSDSQEQHESVAMILLDSSSSHCIDRWLNH